MELIAGYQEWKGEARPVVTIGNFDGVHLGHRQLIDENRKLASKLGESSLCYTFRPHPRRVLEPAQGTALLSTYEERRDQLSRTGIDYLVEEPFSRNFSGTDPKTFFSDVLLRKLNASAIVVGYDFSFGKDRGGKLDLLQSLCDRAGVGLTVVPPFRQDDEVVSSTRIREHLLSSEITIANHLLGYSFFYRGIVARGDGRGRKIGFPTANLNLVDLAREKIALTNGVYRTRTKLMKEGQEFVSVTNIGVRPTFVKEGEKPPTVVETHLLDQDIDLYGCEIEVSFHDKLRDEMKFSGVDELTAQIQIDIEQTRSSNS